MIKKSTKGVQGDLRPFSANLQSNTVFDGQVKQHPQKPADASNVTIYRHVSSFSSLTIFSTNTCTNSYVIR